MDCLSKLKDLAKYKFLVTPFILLIAVNEGIPSEIPEWKIRLSYVLLTKAKQIMKSDPNFALKYLEKAIELYPSNKEAEELLRVSKAQKVSGPTVDVVKPKVKVRAHRETARMEGVKNIKVIQGERDKEIFAEYKGISEEEKYPAWKRGPTIATVLDFYHPEHKGKSFPYYKNYEGFKLNKYIGIWANYEIEKKPVGLETMVLDAKEFARYSKEELKEYISTNDKEFWDWELRYFYKDYLPKLIYKYHTSDTRRSYPGKLVWSSTPLWSENEDYHELKLDFTFRGLRYLGYLRLEPFIRRTKWTSDNDPGFLGEEMRYEVRASCMPLDDLKLILEYTWLKNKKVNHPVIAGETLDAIKRERYYIELIKHFPRRRLKVSLSYLYTPEKWVPTDEEWNKNEVKFYWEKNFTSRLRFRGDINYIHLEREKQPHTPNYIHLTSQWLAIKNKLSKEIAKDLTVSLEYEYGTGLDFSGFDYHNLDAEIELFKPGLIRLKLGSGYTYYYHIDDHVWSLYFKLSESAPFVPVYLFSKKWGNNILKISLGRQYIKGRNRNEAGNVEESFKTYNEIFHFSEETRIGKFLLGVKGTIPIYLHQTSAVGKDNGVTLYTAEGFEYNWKRIDLYGGWAFSHLFQPYMGIRWSKEKMHYSDINILGTNLGISRGPTRKAWYLLTGLKGEISLSKKGLISYSAEYLPSLDTEVALVTGEKFTPDTYSWNVKLGLDYNFYKDLVFFSDISYGNINWDRGWKNGGELLESKIKYLEMILGLKWLF